MVYSYKNGGNMRILIEVDGGSDDIDDILYQFHRED